MKILRYFLPLLAFVTLLSTNLNAMNESDNQKIVYLGWVDSDEQDSVEYIEVPERIARHSTKLSNLLEENNSQECSSRLEVTITISRETLEAVVKCLEIIDSENNIDECLMHHMFSSTINQVIQPFINTITDLNVERALIFFKHFVAAVNMGLNVFLEAKAHLDKIEDKEGSAIIIDVDDTAVIFNSKNRMIELHGIKTTFPYCQSNDLVKTFYIDAVSAGFKIFFVTARMEKTSSDLAFDDGHEATVHNLKSEGYCTFEKVICMPYEKRMEIREQAQGNHAQYIQACADWKECERNKIAQEYTIACTLDDVDLNLKGENVGFVIHVLS